MTNDQQSRETPNRPPRSRRKKPALAKAHETPIPPSATSDSPAGVFEIPLGGTGRVVESAWRFGG